MEDAETDPKLRPAGAYGNLPGRHVTINQIVARNLAYFRKVAGLTQEELGEELGWSKAVVSAAERSWDSKRIRQFSVDDVLAIAMALNVPLTALFLPPEDDGVNVRYVFHVPDGEAAEPAASSRSPMLTMQAVCHGMHDLFNWILSDPGEEDEPAMTAYRTRYVSAFNAYLNADAGAEVADYIEDLTTEERMVSRLERLSGQYDALRGLLTDVDQLQEVIHERLAELRKERPRPPRQEDAEAERPEPGDAPG